MPRPSRASSPLSALLPAAQKCSPPLCLSPVSLPHPRRVLQPHETPRPGTLPLASPSWPHPGLGMAHRCHSACSPASCHPPQPPAALRQQLSMQGNAASHTATSPFLSLLAGPRRTWVWSSGRALLSHLHVNEASPPEGGASPSHVQTSTPRLGPGNPLPLPCAVVAPPRLDLCIQVLITRLSLRKLPTCSLTLYSPPATAPFLRLLTALWRLSHLLILPWGADPTSASRSCWPRSLVTSKLVASGCSRAGSRPLPSTQHGRQDCSLLSMVPFEISTSHPALFSQLQPQVPSCQCA